MQGAIAIRLKWDTKSCEFALSEVRTLSLRQYCRLDHGLFN